MAKRYVVHVRCGYYPPESEFAQFERQTAGVVRLPRVGKGTAIAVSASDACAKVVGWFSEQMRTVGSTDIPEAVACCEVVDAA